MGKGYPVRAREGLKTIVSGVHRMHFKSHVKLGLAPNGWLCAAGVDFPEQEACFPPHLVPPVPHKF